MVKGLKMKAIYIPAGRVVWLDVAKELQKNNIDISIWLGDLSLDNIAKDFFPNCDFYNFYDSNKCVFNGIKIKKNAIRRYIIKSKILYFKR